MAKMWPLPMMKFAESGNLSSLLALLLRFVSCPEVVAESRTVLVETAVVLFLFRFLIFLRILKNFSFLPKHHI